MEKLIVILFKAAYYKKKKVLFLSSCLCDYFTSDWLLKIFILAEISHGFSLMNLVNDIATFTKTKT